MLDQMFTAYMDVRTGRISVRERERVVHLEPTMRKKKRERNLLEGRGTLFHRTAESSWPRTWNQTDRRGESSRDKRQEGFRVCNMKLATIKDGRNGDDANERDGKGREGKRSGAEQGRNVWGRVVAGRAIRVSQMARDRWQVPRLSLMGLNQ
jgi:hypothetical protein